MILTYRLIETRQGHRITSTQSSYRVNTNTDPKVRSSYFYAIRFELQFQVSGL